MFDLLLSLGAERSSDIANSRSLTPITLAANLGRSQVGSFITPLTLVRFKPRFSSVQQPQIYREDREETVLAASKT